MMSVELRLPRAVAGEEPYRLLSEGQVSMGLAGASVQQVSENVWRLDEEACGVAPHINPIATGTRPPQAAVLTQFDRTSLR